MITFSPIRQADDITALSEYFVLDFDTYGSDYMEDRIQAVSILKIVNREVVRETYLPVREEITDSETEGYSLDIIKSGLTKFLPGSAVVAEPESLQYLKMILEQQNCDGEIRFLPACRLAAAVFSLPKIRGIAETAKILSISCPETSEKLQNVYLEANILERCRLALSDGKNGATLSGSLITPYQKPRAEKHTSKSIDVKSSLPVSDETLKHWARSAWTASPWVFAALAIVIFILAVVFFPHVKEDPVDRTTAPVSYLVLSWDKTGKYGTQPKAKAGEENPIQFRIPYGVYNVLNNNSIPVELHILSDSDKPGETDPEGVSLSSEGESPEDELTDSGKVVLRPNSSRQITIDTDQYLTLSEDAKDLILFYLSEVPEEPVSDTTGQVKPGQAVLYAYVKGTEVRFRRAPSLEGQIIDTLNNGQQVQVLAISGEWTHVQVQDQKGYIFSQYLSNDDPNQREVTPPSPSPAAEETESDSPSSIESESSNYSTESEPSAPQQPETSTNETDNEKTNASVSSVSDTPAA